MNTYLIIKTLHIVTATILFGTGLGIAFFMFRSHFSDDLNEKLFALRTTVLADYLFTAPAAILQPLTGAWLIFNGGFLWTDAWLIGTYALYAVAGACWLPVVWIQIVLKRIVAESQHSGTPLPARYHQLFRVWFWLGWPAFLGLVIVFFLMVAKPAPT
jgi:uncharacterized membrane protein